MAMCLKRRIQIICVLLSVILAAFFTKAGAKPTFGFSFAQGLPSFASLTQQFVEKRSATQMKTYSGQRVSNDSLIMIYHHDLTIAVVELGPDKLLLGCELIEITKDEDRKRLLSELSQLNRPLEINFKEMVKLINQCETVDRFKEAGERQSRNNVPNTKLPKRDLSGRNPLTLLSGIIPGTKWCGTGDIATTYHDLGSESIMDRCCRTHDLCPSKVRAYQTRYELQNDSLYTKSHCVCDDMLYSCLQKTNTSAARLMATVYFNIVQVPCIQEGPSSKYEFRNAKEFRA